MNANQIVQRGGGIVRGSLRIGEQVGRRVASEAWGMVQEARHLGRKPKPGMDDVTIAHKVESEIFRGRGASKASVNVNVVDGVVWLRGEVKRPDQIRRLEEKARAVPEVRDVENLLHLVKTPAPTRADTPKRQQRTRSSTKRPSPRRRTTGRVSDDRTDAIAQAEPSPAEQASKGEGRAPAPLGASETGGQPEGAGSGGEPSRGSATSGEGDGSQEVVPSPETPLTGEPEAPVSGDTGTA